VIISKRYCGCSAQNEAIRPANQDTAEADGAAADGAAADGAAAGVGAAARVGAAGRIAACRLISISLTMFFFIRANRVKSSGVAVR